MTGLNAAALASLAGWIDDRLGNEHADRQTICEDVAAQLRDMAAAVRESREDGANQPVTADQPGPGELRAALAAVLEALDIPHAATVGDEETRTKILLERIGHTVVMLQAVLREEHPAPDMAWSVAYLRERLAEHPAEGYKTWAERVAELDMAKQAEPGGAR